ncbi:hypothetical protein GY45DRAFT_497887 [Cubamyces sp. BRFM 1775]|nr:hypothetical protein GY45DRAFT_497887 [Cubamyces sp. BRFM 1775]
MLYLQSMENTPPEAENDKSSSVGSHVLRSPRPKSKAASSVRQLEEHLGGGGEEEEGVPEREPGPDDPPGPHFESYGSSFGNFGPLPRESFTGNKQWNGVVRTFMLRCATA